MLWIWITEYSLKFCVAQKTFSPSFYDRLEVESPSCPQEALADDSNSRLLNVLSFVASILDRGVRRSGDPGAFKYETLWFKNSPSVIALGTK